MNAFVATMPAVYSQLYSAVEMAEHAAISARRGSRLVHAELWQSRRAPLLCVVAEDRPGLLALVTDALLAQGMAIQSARAFCRQVGKDRLEAVDFLEVHSHGDPKQAALPLDDDALGVLVQSLNDLIVDDMARSAAPPVESPPPVEKVPLTRVYFEREPPAEGRYLLVVEAPDSDGLLHAVCSTLHARGLRIMACEIRTLGGHAHDRFEVEPMSQRSLPTSELCDVQFALLDALPAKR